jgi:NTE family protein
MLFHLGTLIRLNEAGALAKIARISSVSGGSITAGQLGLKWKQLGFQNNIATRLKDEVVNPIRGLASDTIDAESVLGGMFLPGTIGDRIVSEYEKHLFGKATLQDLPSDGEGPRFVINATNVQTGSLWRFEKPYMADWRVGRVMKPTVRLSVAVGASSAFPPVLSPVVLELNPNEFEAPPTKTELQDRIYRSKVVLSDGGVYDNLGLETAWKRYRTVLVSDGGGKMEPEPEPKKDWARHAFRVLGVIDNQVRSLRKRQVVEAFKDKTDVHDGAYWSIGGNITEYPADGKLNCPIERTLELAATPTRLKRLDDRRQEQIINWGYAITDAALRGFCKDCMARHGVNVNQAPNFPYPASGV